MEYSIATGWQKGMINSEMAGTNAMIKNNSH